MHVYARRVLEAERTSLSVIADFIDAGQTVLDLGMGNGSLGHYIKTQKFITIDGLTLNPAEADLARESYRQVVVADLDTANLEQLFAGETYDWIVCADVLEHLKHPESVLAQCKSRLRPDGQIITSIPNAAYCGLLAELMQGDFRYRNEGLLDATHLRFFTRQSLHRWFDTEGWHLVTVATIDRHLGDSEFKVAFDALPPAVARYLLARPDALSYQYISVATPQERAPNPQTLARATDEPPKNPAAGVFSTQLYMDCGAGYDESFKLVQAGEVGQLQQKIEFSLPACPEHPYRRLRLDPADRAGFMHFYGVELSDDEGGVLWRWSATEEGNPQMYASPPHDILLTSMWPTTQGLLATIFGEDPQIELAITANALLALSTRGGSLRLEVGWPMSSDYLLATQALAEQRKNQQDRNTLHVTLALEHANLRTAHQALQTQHHALSESQQQTVVLLREAERASNDWQSKHRQLEEHLQWIERSTIFRATRPIVALKMRLDRLFVRKPLPPPPVLVSDETRSPSRQVRLDLTIDVIVPVFRGLEDTRTCLESVTRSRSSAKHRIIVINDCSPEPEVTDWLRHFAQQHDHVTLLENEENLGFVRTVNKGMALSDSNDVILLNSDAEVANDWLDRLQQAAYSSDRVGTVTPFSNNATICSYPTFCSANPMPLGLSVADMDALCANVLAGRSVELPTGHGFCMYARRDCLTQVGLFDETHFGKGYGEENDFCVRATEFGWKHLHALDVFVRHAGGVSFGASKSERELQAMETLRRLHPQYEPSVHRFLQQDPAKPARLALDIARIANTGRRAILNVTHNRDGGTLRHQQELAQHFDSTAIFLQLKPSTKGAALELTGVDEALRLNFQLPTQLDLLTQSLRQLGVAHIHYHHLLGHDDWVLELPSKLGITHDFTAHDYYTYCPQISLTDHTDRYCSERGKEQCQQCLRRNPAPNDMDIDEWRQRHLRLLGQARVLLTPTDSTGRRMRQHVPQANIAVVPHIDMDNTMIPVPMPRRLDETSPIKVAVIGALSRIKGADVLEEVALLAAKTDAPIEFHLIGYGYRHLRVQPKARLTVHGAYQEEELPQILEWLQPDLVWFPAQWPETYSYTLSSCLKAGLPVLAPQLGAFSDRLAGQPWAWLVDWQQTPEQWLALLLDLRRKHFLTGVPPTTIPAERSSSGWTYGANYLRGISAAKPLSAEETRKLALALHPLLDNPSDRKGDAPALLRWLTALRAAPGLSTVAKHIPGHWQRKVKNWLSSRS